MNVICEERHVCRNTECDHCHEHRPDSQCRKPCGYFFQTRCIPATETMHQPEQ